MDLKSDDDRTKSRTYLGSSRRVTHSWWYVHEKESFCCIIVRFVSIHSSSSL